MDYSTRLRVVECQQRIEFGNKKTWKTIQTKSHKKKNCFTFPFSSILTNKLRTKTCCYGCNGWNKKILCTFFDTQPINFNALINGSIKSRSHSRDIGSSQKLWIKIKFDAVNRGSKEIKLDSWEQHVLFFRLNPASKEYIGQLVKRGHRLTGKKGTENNHRIEFSSRVRHEAHKKNGNWKFHS